MWARRVFCWNALGVPMNQMNCFLNEGVTAEQFAKDTLDPIARSVHRQLNASLR
jgi:betaine lipid synthase